MAIVIKSPLTPGQRGQISDDYEDITRVEPERSLIVPLKKNAGRDNSGRISSRHRGGGNRQFYRIIDFKRDKDNVAAEVLSIEYDPCRNLRIALLRYDDGEKRYILAPLGIGVGDKISSGEEVEIKVGNAMPLKNIPIGTFIHNVELTKGEGGKLARSAGAVVQLSAKQDRYAIVRLPSGEQRMVHIECRATIGQLGNVDAKNIRKGKAGKTRHMGRRPKVRGVAMNPCDHPHGGGEGRSGIGRVRPVSPEGKPALGHKTRRKRNVTDRFILIRRS